MRTKWTVGGAVALLIITAFVVWKRLHRNGLEFTDLKQKDPYEAIARATGGSVIRLGQADVNAGALTAHVQALLKEDGYAPLLIAEGDIRSSPVEFSFWIDSSIETLSAAVSGIKGKPQAEFYGPGNRVATPARTLSSQVADRMSFDKPAPGRWKVRISAPPTENVRLVVKAETALSIDQARIVRPGGRPGHEGLFKYDGPLQPGRDEQLEVKLDGGALKDVSVRLVSLDGREIGKARIPPAKSDPEGEAWARLHGASQDGSDTILAQVRIPDESFRVQIEGESQAGEQVVRVYEREFVLGRLVL